MCDVTNELIDLSVCLSVCLPACLRACVRACVRTCVCVCGCVRVSVCQCQSMPEVRTHTHTVHRLGGVFCYIECNRSQSAHTPTSGSIIINSVVAQSVATTPGTNNHCFKSLLL